MLIFFIFFIQSTDQHRLSCRLSQEYSEDIVDFWSFKSNFLNILHRCFFYISIIIHQKWFPIQRIHNWRNYKKKTPKPILKSFGKTLKQTQEKSILLKHYNEQQIEISFLVLPSTRNNTRRKTKVKEKKENNIRLRLKNKKLCVIPYCSESIFLEEPNKWNSIFLYFVIPFVGGKIQLNVSNVL